MISEGSCDTEDWSIFDALPHSHKLKNVRNNNINLTKSTLFE